MPLRVLSRKVTTKQRTGGSGVPGVRESDMIVFRDNTSRPNIAYSIVNYDRDIEDEELRYFVEARNEQQFRTNTTEIDADPKDAGVWPTRLHDRGILTLQVWLLLPGVIHSSRKDEVTELHFLQVLFFAVAPSISLVARGIAQGVSILDERVFILVTQKNLKIAAH